MERSKENHILRSKCFPCVALNTRRLTPLRM